MFEIHYDNPRKFLMSFGITLFLITGIIYWSTVVFLFEKIEYVVQNPPTSADEAEIFQLKLELMEDSANIASILSDFCLVLAVGGALSFLVGSGLWIKELRYKQNYKK